MIDTTTRQPLQVLTAGDAGPYIVVPVAQLDLVKPLLDANKILYWVDEEAISLDGNPEVAVVNLVRGCNPVTVQRLLDSLT